MNDLEGAVMVLDDLFTLTAGPMTKKVESFEGLLEIVEGLGNYLQQEGFFKERSLVLHGIVSFAETMVPQ